MCDYSITAPKSRKARVGDRLKSSNFNGGSAGFADKRDADTAICLMPGTELAFSTRVVKGLPKLGGGVISAAQLTARFRQIDVDNPHTHHDVLEFPNGEKMYVASLPLGVEASVLQLPATPRTPQEAVEQRRAEFVG